MVLDPIPQSLSVHLFGSRPQPPTSRCQSKDAFKGTYAHTHVQTSRHTIVHWRASTHTYKQTENARVFVCVSLCLGVYVYVCVYLCGYVYVCICTCMCRCRCMCMCMCMCTGSRSHAYTHTHQHIPTYTHTERAS